jgi:protein-disulfide isomerase
LGRKGALLKTINREELKDKRDRKDGFKLVMTLGDDLRFAYRHFSAPAEVHPHAWIAAEAALDANAQGKFWEMHRHLFRRQKALEQEHLKEYVAELALDMV